MTATGTVKASLESKVPDGSGINGTLRREMWANLGKEYVSISVYEVSQRVEPSVNSDADPAVKLRLIDCEIADGEDAEHLRELMQAWYRARTRGGTFDEDDAARPTPTEQADTAMLMLTAAAADIVDAEVVDDPEILRAQLLTLVEHVVAKQYVNPGEIARIIDADDTTVERLLATAQTLGVVSPLIEKDAVGEPYRNVLATPQALEGILADIGSRLELIFPDPAPRDDAAVADERDDEVDMPDDEPDEELADA